MTAETSLDHPAAPRKPRIALMGEFSAGKSTLANILMREVLSPVQITATQLPPLWYSWGDGPPVRITADGREIPLEDNDLHGVPIADTRAIRLQIQADILEACDLVDMPGSSDPNMTVDVWAEMLPLVDGVIWCTPATQAWRQSEAAMWEALCERLAPHSLLLLTRFDKILSADDRSRLLKRVRRETASMFRSVHPVSLIEAQAAGHDADLWQASGMEAVIEDLLRLVTDLERVIANKPQVRREAVQETPPPAPAPAPQGANAEAPAPPAPAPIRAEPAPMRAEPAPLQLARPSAEAAAGRSDAPMLPRRVVPRTGIRTERPRGRRADASGSLI